MVFIIGYVNVRAPMRRCDGAPNAKVKLKPHGRMGALSHGRME